MAKIFLAYDHEKLQDGYFAQFQRQMAIYAIARKFHFRYLHFPILNIRSHQVDLFQEDYEIKKYLQTHNPEYELISDELTGNIISKLTLDCPTLFNIYKILIKNIFKKGVIIILISNPYRIIERHVNAYKFATNYLNTKLDQNFLENDVVMHIRMGISSSHITPGENSSRVLNMEYFVKIAKSIKDRNFHGRPLRLLIYTDAPEFDEIYIPSVENSAKWQEFGYRKNSTGGIVVQGHKFNEITSLFDGNFKIIRGGNPNDAVTSMRNARYLIMSRSSMSYVGALLNQFGDIFYPPNFWHKALKNWIKVLS
jgi:hypothetical protein